MNEIEIENLSDNILDLNSLRIQNVGRCEEVFHKLDDWSPSDWATALAGEVGECCNFIKKLRRLDGADAHHDTPKERDFLKQEIGKELADILIYLDLLAARFDIDLSEVTIKKFNEVSDKRGSTYYL